MRRASGNLPAIVPSLLTPAMGSVNLYPRTPLMRNGSSLFSSAFDDSQNIRGEPWATNLASMSTDELQPTNMWTAEESQAMAAAMNPVEGLYRGLSSQFSLQKQGSLGLPRTLTTDDLWKIFLPQQSNTEAVSTSASHQQQSSSENTKAEVVKERPIRGEATLEDFLVKAGIARETPSSNHVGFNEWLTASGHQVPSNQSQQVPTAEALVPSYQAHQVPSYHAHQVPTNQSLEPSKKLQQASPIRTLTPSSQMQQATPIRTLTHSSQMQQATPPMRTSRPTNQMQQQVPPILVHRQAAPINPSPINQQGAHNQVFRSISGFPISRNDGGLEHKNVQVAPRGLNNFIPTAANLFDCPPSSAKPGLDVLRSVILPGQQGDCIGNLDKNYMMHQKQDARCHTIAEAASALGSLSNTVDGHRESSPGCQPPLGGGLGAVLGTGGLGMSRGGNGCSKSINFGPCSPLSLEMDEGNPGAISIPLSLISEFRSGQSQKKKRSSEPPVERVIERRQKRMIKNRESAARSRARKQAYTVELEEEVSQLKEENMALLKKQEDETASRKKQILALMPSTPDMGCKGRRSLKRTHTGPW